MKKLPVEFSLFSVVALLLTLGPSCTNDSGQQHRISVCHNQEDRIWGEIIATVLSERDTERFSVEAAVKEICERRTLQEFTT